MRRFDSGVVYGDGEGMVSWRFYSYQSNVCVRSILPYCLGMARLMSE